jgi:hypothetical protein
MLLCYPSFWLLFPSGRAWKISCWMRSPPPSTCGSSMNFIGNSIGNFRNPTRTFEIPHECSHTTGWTTNPFILQTLIFHPLKIHLPWVFFLGYPSSFVDRRMGRCEWMAWMWFAHETTPSIQNASMTRAFHWLDCEPVGHYVVLFMVSSCYNKVDCVF